MKAAGQVILFRFPQTNLQEGKLRPALLLAQLPNQYDDWLIAMISSQIQQYISGFDKLVQESDEDFEQSGLKLKSVIRVGRLAVVTGEILLGAIGQIPSSRLSRVKQRLVAWLSS